MFGFFNELSGLASGADRGYLIMKHESRVA
jgi:hypothetical protein